MRYGLSVLMLVLLVSEMAFFYLPPVLHEIIGVFMLIPIFYHLGINRRYVSFLGRGHWNGPRSVRLILNILLMAACFMTIVSGCLTSSQLFADVVPFSLRSILPCISCTARRHGISSCWRDSISVCT